ncbi:YitT family protein [Geminicoccus roseus]|uniref:YitT family protein n=1 Tax=Geminicoccus roseus TaxID=404900 RepID=UPI000685E0C0|nr:YitT family protein [Geminicoccus roseus]
MRRRDDRRHEPARPGAGLPHRLHEDVLAILLGTLLVALGITLYAHATLFTGSTAGLALLLHYVTGHGFWIIFFVVNLPFYYLAVRRMGWQLALRTFLAVLLLSLFARLTPDWISLDHLEPLYAAVTGGTLMGIGMLMLFRHRTGLGGINILALYLQDRHRIRAGYFQFGVDAAILAGACFVLPPAKILLSALGAAVLNLIIALNHRPGRYVGVS